VIKTAGNVDAGTSTIVFQGGDKTVNAAGVAFHDVVFNLGSGGDLTVIGTLDVNGNLTIGGNTSSTLASGTVAVAGDITTTNTGFSGAGTIRIDGAGNQTLSAAGGAGQVGNLTVQKSGGTLFLADTIEVWGNLLVNSGVIDAGTSTIEFQGGDKTVSAAGVAFHNVVLNLSGGGDLSVVGTLDVDGDLAIRGSTSSTLASGTVAVAGNVTTTNNGFSGAGTILIDGAGDQTLSAAGGAGQVGNLTVQKSGGTLFLADTIEVWGNLLVNSGVIDAGTSTIEFQGGDKTVSAAGVAFHNVVFNLSGGGDLSVVGTLDVDGDLAIRGSTSSTLASGTVAASGNVTTTNTGFSGAGTILIDGAGDQTLSAAGGAGQVGNLTVQKSGGTLFLVDTIEVWGNLLVNSGVIDAGTSTIEFQGGDKTVDAAGVAFHNVVFNLSGGGDLSVVGTLDVDGDLTIRGSSSSTLASGTVAASGNVTNQNGGFRGNGLLLLDGTGDQILNFPSQYRGNLTINKPSGTAILATDLSLVGSGYELHVDSNNLDLAGHTLAVGGTFDFSVGTLFLNGNLTILNGGTLALNLAGFNVGEFEALIVGGQLTLGTTLRLALDLNGITGEGTAYSVIQFGSLSGQFGTLQLANSPAGHTVELNYDLSAGVIDVVVAEIPQNTQEYPIFSLQRFDGAAATEPDTVVYIVEPAVRAVVDAPHGYRSFERLPEFDVVQQNTTDELEDVSEPGDKHDSDAEPEGSNIDDGVVGSEGVKPSRGRRLVPVEAQRPAADGTARTDRNKAVPTLEEIEARYRALDRMFVDLLQDGLEGADDADDATPANSSTERTAERRRHDVEMLLLASAMGAGLALGESIPGRRTDRKERDASRVPNRVPRHD